MFKFLYNLDSKQWHLSFTYQLFQIYFPTDSLSHLNIISSFIFYLLFFFLTITHFPTFFYLIPDYYNRKKIFKEAIGDALKRSRKANAPFVSDFPPFDKCLFYLFHWIYVIYLYHIIFKSCLTFIVIIFPLSQISGYIIPLFLTFSLSFLSIFLLINLSSHNYSSSNIFPTFNFLFPHYSIP